MSYKNSIGANNPSMVLILIDQSGSMVDPYYGSDKQTQATKAVNRVIYEIIENSHKGDGYSDRCYIGVIGYGDGITQILGGMINEVSSHPLSIVKNLQKVSDNNGGLVDVELEVPIWVTPKADNGTPMAEAFDHAYELVQNWITNHPDCFPPVILNISDGMPNNESQSQNNALRLMQLSTSDGNVLIFNAHIQESQYEQVLLPAYDTNLNSEARFLYSISSTIPDSLAEKARMVGFNPQPGARGFVYKADVENMIRLLTFGSSMARNLR